MSKFTAPSWDVDRKANTLCDNFSKGQKVPQSKKKHKKSNASCDTVGRQPGSGKPLTLKKASRQVQLKNKQNNSLAQKGFKKGKEVAENVNVRHFQNHKESNKKFDKKPFGNKQKLKNFKHGKSDFIRSEESFSTQKNHKKRELQISKNQKEQKTKINDFKSLKKRFKDRKNQKGNFQPQNHSDDVSFHQQNSKVKNRKRNSDHLSDIHNNGPSVKKKKFGNDGSKQELHTSSEKQVINKKEFLNRKKFNKQANKVVNNTSNNENGEMKSPFQLKNRFFDSSLSLRERMLMQLKSSRFRYINEQLYTSDSKNAEEMFKQDPNLFKVYHEGFRQQVEQWPENPVEKIIKAIQRKPPNLVVADFGCGDAKLAKSVPNKVHSFDLVALSDEVTVCDMAHTPLESGCVDICVFCLSLMGTNLNSYLLEANRILKVGGTLKIAEVASRFTSIETFIKDMGKYKFSLIQKDLSNDLFYFLNFKKVSDVKKAEKLPNVSLSPCWYKKR
ncbi:hypothetical protein R5R35_009704 [Gryllus longicercus]|uniref:Ribosomal RNA-processing protein 8 n=1 Tax=Gryllus longicercus TaxID=2509291 RepID=A0AAN9W0V3_9ORTH